MDHVSIIVTTYNWPEVLEACLQSLLDQDDTNFEVIVADDGSSQDTKALIERFMQQKTISIKHVLHEDRGFRAGTIRNKAVALSKGNYLIFLDGDCVVLPNFVRRHRQLAECGYFVPGNRILLSQSYTAILLADKLFLHKKSMLFFINLWLQRKINRLFPLVYTPFTKWRYNNPQRWQKAMTCNLAMYTEDFIRINGFDEAFEGWGYEDSDLVVRLIHHGIKRKEGRFAVTVLHYWHKENDQSHHDENYHRLMLRLNDESLICAGQGLDSHSA